MIRVPSRPMVLANRRSRSNPPHWVEGHKGPGLPESKKRSPHEMPPDETSSTRSGLHDKGSTPNRSVEGSTGDKIAYAVPPRTMKTCASWRFESQAGTCEMTVDPLGTRATYRWAEPPPGSVTRIAIEPSMRGVAEISPKPALEATRNLPVTAWPNRSTHRPTIEPAGNPENSPFHRTSERPDTLTPVTTNNG